LVGGGGRICNGIRTERRPEKKLQMALPVAEMEQLSPMKQWSFIPRWKVCPNAKGQSRDQEDHQFEFAKKSVSGHLSNNIEKIARKQAHSTATHAVDPRDRRSVNDN
jgi:hypothetical protein